MQIWVDADACPGVIKQILFRAAERAKIQTTLVANQPLRVPPSRYINTVHVSHGFDIADNHIVSVMSSGDLVITADIPLAAQVVAKGGYALDPRGELYTENNIKERLTMRNWMESLRSSGVALDGPKTFNQGDRQNFAASLDRLLARQHRTDSTQNKSSPSSGDKHNLD
ncbi:MAG: YaiI/YqxD family protein [Betaproteobacteria bacterium]|nr:YaiI/YqxD family protein [Betaproteobacteria bacterium]